MNRQTIEHDTKFRSLAICSMWTVFVITAMIHHGMPWIGSCLVISVVFGLIFLLRRDTWLPFLGPTVFPPGVLNATTPPHGMEMSVYVSKDAERVIYWASNPGETVPTPDGAYGRYKNAGVVDVVDGHATMVLACPSQYYVKGKLLNRHVHYREHFPGGLLGPVKSKDVLCS